MEIVELRGPVRPVAPYVGGKRKLASRLVSLIAEVPHTLYAEPFVGMGGVFLRRRAAAKVEVVNDVSRDVATLFRVLQRHYQAFLDMLRWQLTSRAEFERLNAMAPDTLTDLERAARFLYLQRTAFGGRVRGRTFGVTYGSSARFDVTSLAPLLEEVHERLARVVIECLPYEAFVRRYDRPGTLFYLDPPYWDCEDDYGAGVFGQADFERLAELLEQIEGRFILSINDRPEVRRIFAAFPIEPVSVGYSIGADKRHQARELIITSD